MPTRAIVALGGFGLALLVLVSCSGPSASARRELYELQATCGNSARDWFSKRHGRDTLEIGDTSDFANHYNEKLNRCFLLWTETRKDYVYEELIDVKQNEAF